MDSASVVSNKSNSKRSTKLRKKKKKPPSAPGKDANNFEVKEMASDKPILIQLCSPCLREERNVQSTHFCDNCKENLCPACVQQHSKFPTMKDHVIHGRDGEPLPEIPVKVDKCDKHNGKTLDMYCSDHDVVRCAACIAIDHRKCKQVSYLPEAAKNIADTQEYKDVIDQMGKVKAELETSRLRRNEDNMRLAKEREDAIARIKYVRRTINKCLDSLEKRTLENLEKEYTKYNNRVNEDIATCGDIIAKLEVMTKQLQEDLLLDDASRFIQMRRANQTVNRGKRTVEILTEAKGSEQIQFLPDSRVNDLIRSIPALGFFASEQRLLSGSLINQFDVHIAADLSDCQLLGSDFLPDGRALVADWENKKVKLLSKAFKVLDHLKLNGCPYSVCSINQGEGVVSITNKKILQFFTIDERNKMTIGRVVKMAEFCRDVAYNNGKLYVVCGALKEGGVNQVSVFSLDGKFIRNIVTDPSGENLFTRPLYITLNSIGNIFVGDEERGVISLDSNGEVIGIYSDQKVLKYPYGVTIVNNDQIFVCGFGSHNLVQVGRNLMLLGEVLPESAGLRNPRSVCYDINSQRILVTCKNTNFVRVYSLK